MSDPPSSSPQQPVTAVVVLAAGKGSRFPGPTPKLLQPLAGRPLVAYAVEAATGVGAARTVVVVGHAAEAVKAALSGQDVAFALQSEQRGTAHAVLAARDVLPAECRELVVMNGDVPLVRAPLLLALLRHHRETDADITLLSAELDDPSGYGRVVRSTSREVRAIVEDRDASADERAVREINAGIYAFRLPLLFSALAEVDTANAQGELYLTDAVRHVVAWGGRVEALPQAASDEILGVNRPEELALVAAAMERRTGRA